MAQVGDRGDKFAHHAAAVARELLGDHNKQLSSQSELRFGKQGSLSVDVKTGQFFDHQEKTGGGVLWFIERETGHSVAGGHAVEWMRSNGFDVEDDRPPPVRSGNGPRLDPDGNWLPQRVPDHGRLTKTYDYRDTEGQLRYQVCRYDWIVAPSVNPKGREKTFVQRVPDAAKPGGWSYKTKGVTWLPYRLPELVQDVANGRPIFIVEGEKKVDMLREIGVPATTNHGGAGKFPEDLAIYFSDAQVVVLPDNDTPGHDHAGLIARRLEGVARSIKVIDIPGLPPKGGVDDWLPAGGSAEALYDLLDSAARPLEAAPFRSSFGAVQWADFDAAGQTYDYLIKGVLTRGEMSMLLGESQSGKSFLAIDIAMAVARGTGFFGHKVRRGGIIYQAGESALGVRRRRFPAYRQHYHCAAEPLPVVLLERPLDLYTNDEHVDLFIEECRHWGQQFNLPLELIVIDTFNKATPGANENDGKDMGTVLARCDRIRRETGAHVMLVHHLNAGGTKARGHTSLFANVENVITVQKLPDHKDAEGRQIRVWKVAKQKDGEDGKETKFVLRGIDIGTDADGDIIYSCIVAPPSTGEGEQRIEESGLRLSGNNATFLRAIYSAIDKKGVPAPPELTLGTGAMAVTRRDVWEVAKTVFADASPDTDIKDGETPEDAAKRRDGNMRQAVKRAKEALYQKNIIGLKDDWIWLTGKKVIGFEQAPGLSDLDRAERSRRRERSAPTGAGDNVIAMPGVELPWDAEDFQ